MYKVSCFEAFRTGTQNSNQLDPLFDHANIRDIGVFVLSKMALLREIIAGMGSNMTISIEAECLRYLNT